MRLDKYLKVSRVIKRRSVANDACDTGHVSVNGKVAKPSTDVKEGDVVSVRFGANETVFKIKSVSEHASKTDAAAMYEMLSHE